MGTDINLGVLYNQTYPIKNPVCCHAAAALHFEFDLIICNLPYLATDEIIDVATDGGPCGLPIPKGIIRTVASRLAPAGKFLFVSSSLSDYEGLIRYCNTLGMSARVIARKKLFFEELILIEARLVR